MLKTHLSPSVRRGLPKRVWGAALILGAMALSSPVLAQESSAVLESVKTTGILPVALREDSVPFGFRDGPANQWTGICVDFIELLRRRVVQELGGQQVMVKMYQSTLFNRYSLVDKGVVVLECGPNTIQEGEIGAVTFSAPFFIAGTQLLIPTDRRSAFTANPTLEGERIGVLRGTANQRFMAQAFPDAQLVEFQGGTARRRGVQALVQQKIDAFASDGILLFGETLLLNLVFGRDYVLYPSYPLNCEQYGMILPQGDRPWQTLVNDVLQSPPAQETYDKWIGTLFPAMERLKTHCQNLSSPGDPPP